MLDRRLNLRHLAAFVEVYDLGTLVAASEAINITQPAITQGIARLESVLDCKLFDRQSDGMKPTKFAELLYKRAVLALEYIASTRVTFTQIKAFLMLASCGSYAAASNATGLARPSLKRAVTDLQIALRTRFVERAGRGVRITGQGKKAERRYRLALKELENALEEIDELRGKVVGSIVIGAMPLSRARVLPNAILKFKQENPVTQVRVVEGSHSKLVGPLRNGEIDLIIGALRKPHPGADLEQEDLFEDLPVILGRWHHPLKESRKKIDIKELCRFDWCLPRRGVPLRDNWEAMFTQRGLAPPTVAVECGSVMTTRQILMGTDYLTLLSPDQFAVELEAKWIKVVGQAPGSLSREIGLTFRRDWRPTRLQFSFLETLRATCEDRYM